MTVHSESKNSTSVRPSTKQLAISSSGSNSHAETPFSCMAMYCESEMSVWTDSGGLEVTNAGYKSILNLSSTQAMESLIGTHPWLGGIQISACHP